MLPPQAMSAAMQPRQSTADVSSLNSAPELCMAWPAVFCSTRPHLQQVAVEGAPLTRAGHFFADVAQSVEQRFHTPRVAGSIPAISTNHSHSSIQYSTSKARCMQRHSSARTAAAAHSLS